MYIEVNPPIILLNLLESLLQQLPATGDVEVPVEVVELLLRDPPAGGPLRGRGGGPLWSSGRLDGQRRSNGGRAGPSSGPYRGLSVASGPNCPGGLSCRLFSIPS